MAVVDRRASFFVPGHAKPAGAVARLLGFLLFFAPALCAATGPDLIFRSGFDPSYAFQWSTDQYGVAVAGRTYEFETEVHDAQGGIVNDGALVWTLESGQATIVALSTRRIRVTLPSTIDVPIRIGVRHPASAATDQVELYRAQLKPGAYFVSSSDVTNGSAGSLTVASTAPGLAGIGTGSIVVTGDRLGRLERVVSMSTQPGRLLLTTQPGKLEEAFLSLSPPSPARSTTLDIVFDRGQLRATDRDGRLLLQTEMTKDLVECRLGNGDPLPVSFSAFSGRWALSAGLATPIVESANGIEGLQLVAETSGRSEVKVDGLAIPAGVQGSLECKLRLPSIRLPLRYWLAIGTVGLSLGNDVVFSATVGASSPAVPGAQWSGDVNARAGLRYTRADGWSRIGTATALGATTLLPPGVAADLEASAELHYRLSIRLELLVAGLFGDSFDLALLDVGARANVMLRSPYQPERADYRGLSGHAAGFIRGSLAPDFVSGVLTILGRFAVTMPTWQGIVSPTLFDEEFSRRDYPAVGIECPVGVVVPFSQVTCSLTGVPSGVAGQWQLVAYPSGAQNVGWASSWRAIASTEPSITIPADVLLGQFPQANAIDFQVRVKLQDGFIVEAMSERFPMAAATAAHLPVNDENVAPQIRFSPSGALKLQNGTGTILLTPYNGAGTGADATTVVDGCVADPPNGVRVTPASLTFVGSTLASNQFSATCSSEAGVGLFSCNVRRGTQTSRYTFTYSCRSAWDALPPPPEAEGADMRRAFVSRGWLVHYSSGPSKTLYAVFDAERWRRIEGPPATYPVVMAWPYAYYEAQVAGRSDHLVGINLVSGQSVHLPKPAYFDPSWSFMRHSTFPYDTQPVIYYPIRPGQPMRNGFAQWTGSTWTYLPDPQPGSGVSVGEYYGTRDHLLTHSYSWNGRAWGFSGVMPGNSSGTQYNFSADGNTVIANYYMSRPWTALYDGNVWTQLARPALDFEISFGTFHRGNYYLCCQNKRILRRNGNNWIVEDLLNTGGRTQQLYSIREGLLSVDVRDQLVYRLRRDP